MEGIELGRILAGQDHAPVVYFLLIGDRVKIGYSTRLKERVMGLSFTIADVALVVPGGQITEAAFHQRFKVHQIRGEWFHVRGTLARFLKQTQEQRPSSKWWASLTSRRTVPAEAPQPPPEIGSDDQPISLRSACEAGVVGMSLAAIRSARARDPQFPKVVTRSCQTDLYDPSDLRSWVTDRPRAIA